MYQRKVDVDMLNTVKIVLADLSSVSPLSEQRLHQIRLFPDIRELLAVIMSLTTVLDFVHGFSLSLIKYL